ncbi:MAG: UDP-N-acetylmuramate dehydrogenase [Oscillospiraceae bacterium]|nr:UDP-N-acetylmuramate dehydrogenase [Oscillospiraceae bacterium]
MNTPSLQSFLREVRARCPELTVLEGEPMAAHCSFRIGGPCDAMLLPGTAEEIETVCSLLAAAGERPFIMGNGTNLLITDAPLHRIVLRMGEAFSQITARASSLRADAGVTLAQLAVTACRKGLAGLEFAHGIPGTLGGAVTMNAGAYGGEMKDAVTSVTYLDGDLVLRETHDPGFSYRRSRFSDGGDVILAAEVRLREDEEAAIRERMRALLERRRASQPLELPSAGSTFKRPVGGYAAALIDQAGLRGFAVGGAQVSEKHAGFVVNRGGATFDDVLRLMDHIREEVFRRSGIMLEPEVKIIRE